MPGADEQADHGTALHLTANLFAVAFGLAGLAQIVAALAWLITLVAYLVNVAAQHRWKTELSDPTFGPFTALAVIVPMLLGARLAEQARGAGEVVFACGVVLARRSCCSGRLSRYGCTSCRTFRRRYCRRSRSSWRHHVLAAGSGHRREVSSATMSAADCGCVAKATLCPAHIDSASMSPVVPTIGGAPS
jgi:hypothetical protein